MNSQFELSFFNLLANSSTIPVIEPILNDAVLMVLFGHLRLSAGGAEDGDLNY